jgi:hypothetical protein
MAEKMGEGGGNGATRWEKSREWDARISESKRLCDLRAGAQFVSSLRTVTKALVRELARALQKALARCGKYFAALPKQKNKT